MIRIFIGFDHRQPVSYQVLHHSIMRRASVPVQITPLVLHTLPITRQGLTPFTFSRFLVPWLCDYEGHAIFMDSDMLCLGDVAELVEWGWRAVEDSCTNVAVRPFDGREKFERGSLMYFKNDCCTDLTPDFVGNEHNNPLDMSWADYGISNLPPEWNRLVGYEDCSDAKILHYTAGVPAWPETQKPGWHADEWLSELHASTGIAPFETLMGNSVHVKNLKMNQEVLNG